MTKNRMSNESKVALEFLLFSYFGLSRNDLYDEELIRFAAIDKAYSDAARHVLRLFPDNEEYRRIGTIFLMDNIRPDKDASDVIDKFMTQKFVNATNDCCEEQNQIIEQNNQNANGRSKAHNNISKMSKRMRYSGIKEGHVQKWVNMACKYIIIIYSIRSLLDDTLRNPYNNYIVNEKYHIPVDSYIMKESGIKGAWSIQEDYKMLENEVIRSSNYLNSISKFEWENCAWIKQSQNDANSLSHRYKNIQLSNR